MQCQLVPLLLYELTLLLNRTTLPLLPLTTYTKYNKLMTWIYQ